MLGTTINQYLARKKNGCCWFVVALSRFCSFVVEWSGFFVGLMLIGQDVCRFVVDGSGCLLVRC